MNGNGELGHQIEAHLECVAPEDFEGYHPNETSVVALTTEDLRKIIPDVEPFSSGLHSALLVVGANGRYTRVFARFDVSIALCEGHLGIKERPPFPLHLGGKCMALVGSVLAIERGRQELGEDAPMIALALEAKAVKATTNRFVRTPARLLVHAQFLEVERSRTPIASLNCGIHFGRRSIATIEPLSYAVVQKDGFLRALDALSLKG